MSSSPRSAPFLFVVCAVLTFFLVRPAAAFQAEPDPRPPAAPLEREKHSLLELRLLAEGLVDVRSLDPTIMVDLKYARPDNFMGAKAYEELTRAFLRPEAARKLARANAILRERHPRLCILVGDALRPRSIQRKMWAHVAGTPRQPYVANPRTGSMHNHGGAVDVCLYDVEKGERLDMGTPFDHFGPLAQPRLEAKYLREGKLTARQVENRLILREAMREAGWRQLPIEWWHFDAFPLAHIRKNYPIIE